MLYFNWDHNIGVMASVNSHFQELSRFHCMQQTILQNSLVSVHTRNCLHCFTIIGNAGALKHLFTLTRSNLIN